MKSLALSLSQALEVPRPATPFQELTKLPCVTGDLYQSPLFQLGLLTVGGERLWPLVSFVAGGQVGASFGMQNLRMFPKLSSFVPL